ncbi:MAG: response regulator transcription factor [Firmicutes bacterium]|nr:response regulator transcription factor [Bacillota bacterium]
MKVAICDDNKKFCEELFKMIEEYKKRNHISIETDIFLFGKDLIDNIESGEYYNLIFMDIELGNLEHGSDLGNYLRETIDNQTTCIAYISSYKKYAMELFKSRPLDFIEKPITKEKLERVFNAYFKISNSENAFIKVKIGFQTNIILCKDILYFERKYRKIYVVTRSEKYGCYMKFDEIKNLDGFIEIHKSFVVNVNYIKAYSYDTITLTDNTVLTISQSKRAYVKKYMEEI